MNKRRPSGDGMIRHRSNGRWEGRIVIGHNNDHSAIFCYFSADSQRELLDKLNENRHYFATNYLCEKSSMLVGEWFEEWLEQYAKPSVRPSTLCGYRDALITHLTPFLGNVQIRKLTSEQIQVCYRELEEHGRIRPDKHGSHRLSPTTIRGIHNVLHQSLGVAVNCHLMTSNPSEGLVLPHSSPTEMKILTVEQVKEFLSAIPKDILWPDLFYTELTTGLRVGELCGLRWEDLDQDTGKLCIRRTVHKDDNGTLFLGDTKTYQSHRTIILPPSTLDLLKHRHEKKITEDWIFPNIFDTRNPLDPAKPYRKLKEILKTANLPDIRFHDLRHTFATNALSDGIDIKTLSAILGHTKASFTLDCYTHSTGTMQHAAASIVESFLPCIMPNQEGLH